MSSEEQPKKKCPNCLGSGVGLCGLCGGTGLTAEPTPQPAAPEADVEAAVRIAQNYCEDVSQKVADDGFDSMARALLQARAELERYRRALARLGKTPEECTGQIDGTPCVSHLAYEELEAELERFELERDQIKEFSERCIDDEVYHRNRAEKAEAELDAANARLFEFEDYKRLTDNGIEILNRERRAVEAELERAQGDCAEVIGKLLEFEPVILGYIGDIEHSCSVGLPADHWLNRLHKLMVDISQPHPGAAILLRLERAELCIAELKEVEQILEDPRSNLTHTVPDIVREIIAERDGLRVTVTELNKGIGSLHDLINTFQAHIKEIERRDAAQCEHLDELTIKLATYRKTEAEAMAGEPPSPFCQSMTMLYRDWVAYAHAQAFALGVCREALEDAQGYIASGLFLDEGRRAMIDMIDGVLNPTEKGPADARY